MKSLFIPSGLFLLAALVVAGCDPAPFPGVKEIDSQFHPIEEGIYVSLTEAHLNNEGAKDPHAPVILLQMTTVDTFPDPRFFIASELKRSDSEVEIDIRGVGREKEQPAGLLEAGETAKRGGPGDNMPGISTSIYRFGAWAGHVLDLEPGVYSLVFNYREAHRLELTVTDTSLALSDPETSFIIPGITLFWRHPPNSFVYACSAPDEVLWACTEFEEQMNDSLEIEPFMFPDYGVRPYIGPGGGDVVSYYRYPEEEVFTRAGNMLRDYFGSLDTENGSPSARVRNWRNVYYKSRQGID